MVKTTEETTPLTTTMSPNIMQETKNKFDELISEALKIEPTRMPEILMGSSSIQHFNQFDGVPKIVPRQRKKDASLKSEYIESSVDLSSIYSSEGSAGITKTKGHVIQAEIHSSRTHLVETSSDDETYSTKKEKRKKKKPRWRQEKESVDLKVMGHESPINESLQMNETNDHERSSSRLSGKSYTVQTPTFTTEISRTNNSKTMSCKADSPSRLSNKSYIVEIPTFLVEPTDKNEYNLPKKRTPVPLPRKKTFVKTSVDQIKVPKNSSVERPEVASSTADDIYESVSGLVEKPTTKPELAISPTNNLHRTNIQKNVMDAHRDKKHKLKKRTKQPVKLREQLELQELSEAIYAKEETISDQKSGSCSLGKYSSSRDSTNESIPGRPEVVVGVTVHGVNCALVDPLVRHPVVRLHVINSDTGLYMAKSDPARSVCYFNEHSDYVQPIFTHPFDFKKHRSVVAQWEECLLLNENPSHLFTSATLLLFEVCDFLKASAASARHHQLGSSAAWHIVAWAFLRPIGAWGTRNLDTKLNLQLYLPHKSSMGRSTQSPKVYEWWESSRRCKYPGCLSVTIGAVDMPAKLPSPRLRSRLAMQSEVASLASVRSASGSNADNKEQSVQDLETSTPVAWSRLAAQSCKLPNTGRASLPVDGCMALRFSPSGLWLACASQDIHLYSVPEFKHATTLTGHQGLIYCLRWSDDSKLLLSTSADFTVTIWSPQNHTAPVLQILAHPSYVYGAVFVGGDWGQSVVTGCRDGIVRLWRLQASAFRLTQELSAHAGFVSAVSLAVDGRHVFTTDSIGSIRIYQLDNDGCLLEGRELHVRELRGVVINNLLVHPGGHRMLIHTRDSCLRSVDIATGAVIQTLKGCSNETMQTGACISPCGSLVFACGEDGSVVAWDGYTGLLKAVYLHLLPQGSAAVHYHPYDHLMAVASLQAAPLLVLGHNRQSTGEDIGLHFVTEEMSSASDIVNQVITSRIKSTKRRRKTDPKTPQSPPSIKLNFDDVTTNQTFSSQNIPKSDEQSTQDKDKRLLEIINKMDSIIHVAKQTSQGQSLKV